MERKIACMVLCLLLAVNLFPGCLHDDEMEQLLHVKVASWYRLVDYEFFNRTLDDVITHLEETQTDFVFRAFWRYNVIPEEYYDTLGEAIDRIKVEKPDTIVCAGIPTERVNAMERNPITGRNYSREETWAMALDPQKWNISITKEEFQWNRGRLLGFIPSWMDTPDKYDWTKAFAYYPDITNPAFQELQLSWAKHLIDKGVDAIWIDMLFAQARIFYELTDDPHHPAVEEAYQAALKQIEEIHKYGKEKERYIYVGGWTNFLEIKDENGKPAYPAPDFDFVVNMIWENEVKNKNLFEERWDNFFGKVKKYLGNDVLVLIFMDEAAVKWEDQPLGIFSQLLSKEEQKEFLRKADKFFERKREEFGLPIVFVYPLHGGWMGSNAEILSYGKYKIYDALAPEFQTYETIKELAREKKLNSTSSNLGDTVVAVQYRHVTDGGVINRSVDDVIEILRELETDFIFEGWMTQKPCPDECSDLPPDRMEVCELLGYSYEYLKEAISEIKKELPNVIFCGGTQAEFLYPEEVGESRLILEPGDRDRAWEMALDPMKWGIDVSKRDVQCYWAKRWGDIGENEPCPSEEELKQRMEKYFPDITNTDFQKIFLDRIYKQIDAGVDAIWIDMLYMQARLMEILTEDPDHPAVKESYEAAREIVDKIHEYGKKKGKHIYVITWVAVIQGNSIVDVPEEYVNVDAAMVSPSPNEIKDKFTGEIGKFNEELWDALVKKIKEEYEIPIFARIDYGGPGRTQLYVFSQELTKEEAREFLRKADEFFSKKGIIFIYPVHGGDMGRKEIVKKLSYGKFNWYDALAPEFETYETIKQLAQNKSEENPIVIIERPRKYLYVFDREIVPLRMPVILGDITVIAEASDEDGIQKVEFYVNDILKSTDYEEPYSWLWDEFAMGEHELKIIAYDNKGNEAQDEVKVMIFNLGGER